MGQRRIGQASLAEALLPAGVGSNRRLERIIGLIDWAPIERLLAPLRAPAGRPGYPPLALFRALLLAQWYQLSDPGLEEALADRLSFRRFCGFGLDDGTPDETTLCRFRGALAERGLAEALFAELNRQLDTKGLVLKAGTLIDATLVEAAVARPPQSEGEVSALDPQAGFTRRGQRSFFGFKAHVAVDLGSDLIRDAVLTGADIGDSLAADGLVQGDEAAVFMDKAYDSAPRREALFVRVFDGAGNVREDIAGDVLASITTMQWNGPAKGWNAGAPMDDANLNRRQTLRVGASVAYAQVGVIGFDGPIDLQSLRLYGLPEGAPAVLNGTPLLTGALFGSGRRDFAAEVSWDLPNLAPGAASLPSNAMEIGYPDVPSFDVCTGVRADTLEMDFTPTGAATATFGLLGQASVRTGATSGGTPTSAAYTAFNKAQGSITRSGSALAQVTGARLTYANGMEAVRTIRADRRVEGVDPGIARCTGQITVRFENTTLLAQAQAGTAAEFAMAFSIDANRSLTITLHEVYLALAKTPIEGPAGVEASFDFRAAFNATATRMMTAVLRNQQAGLEYA